VFKGVPASTATISTYSPAKFCFIVAETSASSPSVVKNPTGPVFDVISTPP